MRYISQKHWPFLSAFILCLRISVKKKIFIISQQFKLIMHHLKNTELLYYHRNIPKGESDIITDRGWEGLLKLNFQSFNKVKLILTITRIPGVYSKSPFSLDSKISDTPYPNAIA
jgi:hypothetical protein